MGLGDIFRIKKFKAEIERLKESNSSLFLENERLQSENSELTDKFNELGGMDYENIKIRISQLEKVYSEKEKELREEYLKKKVAEAVAYKEQYNRLTIQNQKLSVESYKLTEDIEKYSAELEKLIKATKTQTNKLSRSKELVKAINYTFDTYLNYEPSQDSIKFPTNDLADLEEFSPSVILKLHCMDVKDLRKAYRENDKQINHILEKYSARYTTKANQAIYKLMVIALRAELQNILYNLKYEKLETSVEDVKKITQKYLTVAGEGNQSIVGILTKFIGEIEYLFINAVKIEYNYYVKKEQAKQEQLAIREQMRQEAEERKALEAERKKVEQEEAKYQSEINKLNEQLETAQNEEIEKLKSRILQLQSQLSDVVIKKEEISNLANGKAGNVYVISNLGSFGDNVFKIGMTRRLNPQERVNELGDASVPFKFDVHSFIFSDDAVGLEGKLHKILDEKRVNKVNRRREFFYTTIDELEKLVTEIEPTAEFNKMMLAEEFRQSQSSDSRYSSNWIYEDDEDN